MFIDEPRALEIPPARRREHGVEAGIGQAVQIVPADADGPGEQAHFRMTLAHRRAEPPPDVRGHLVRRVEAKAADSRVGEQQQFARPPFGEVLRRFAITEIRVCNVFLARRVTRIEPRLGALERMEPVLVLLIQPAIGAHAVDHDIDQQRQAVLLRGIGELGGDLRSPVHRIRRRHAGGDDRRRPDGARSHRARTASRSGRGRNPARQRARTGRASSRWGRREAGR